MDGSRRRWDVLIQNAMLFDGSGAAPRRQDVAIIDERIAAIGEGLAAGDATSVIDAAGQWLMPGLLDIHTHFDLEVEIEPGLPEAVRHGTTTVVVANCSLGLAFGNQRRDGADPIVDCFARVENVPKHVLRKVGDQVNWNDSQAYLDHFDQLALGPNIVPMIPHSMLRIEVMGLQPSVSRHPTAEELQRMGELVEKGMREGYVGFSTDALPFHFMANRPNTDKQIPTQFAPFRELKFLTGIVRRWDRVWQATPPKDRKLEVLRNFLLTSGRFFGKPLKLTAVAAIDIATNKSVLKMGLLLTRVLNSKFIGGHFRLQALAASFTTWSDGMVTPIAEEVPELRRLNECELDDRAGRLAILNDPDYVLAFRKMWLRGKRGFTLANFKRLLGREDNVLSRRLDEMFIESCPVTAWNSESMHKVYQRLLQWQRDGQGARDPQEHAAFESFPQPLADDADFMLHLLRRYDTELRWYTTTANRDPQTTKRLLFDPQLLPGFNDSGAHLTNMAFYDGNLRTLKLAQEDGLSKVAHAVHRLTQEPAQFFGLNVGLVEVGAQADLALIDPQALQRWLPQTTVRYIWRECFENHQLVNRPEGVVAMTLIAGRVAWSHGAYVPEFGQRRYGRVLRHSSHEVEVKIAA